MKCRLILAVALLTLVASGAAADAGRRFVVHSEDGAFFQEERGADAGLPAPPLTPRDALLWQRSIPGNIYTSCAMLNAAVFAGTNNGASCVAEFFADDLNGTPDWTFAGGENYVTAGAGYLALVEAVPAIAGVRLHMWTVGVPPTPLWEKEIPNCSAPLGCLRIASVGNLLALAVNTAASSTTYALDPLTGALLSSFVAPAGEFARALRVSEDGTRIALRNGATLHVLDPSTGLPLFTGNVNASSDALAFSPDGHWLAAGWTLLYVWEWNGSAYQYRWSNNGGGANWYLGTCALDNNGQLIAGWYTTSYNRNKVMWFDAAISTPAWTYLFPPSSGTYQDLPVASAMTEGAGIIGSWGDAEGLNPELSAFLPTQAEPFFTVNTTGSIYDVDAEAYDIVGGRYPAYFAGCGKHVHANQFGSGGDLYLADVSPPTAAPALPASGLDLVAYPNPCRATSTLRLSLPRAEGLRVDIHGVDGRHLRRLWAGPSSAGELSLVWDGRDEAGRDLASGVYLARAEAAELATTLRLVLLR